MQDRAGVQPAERRVGLLLVGQAGHQLPSMPHRLLRLVDPVSLRLVLQALHVALDEQPADAIDDFGACEVGGEQAGADVRVPLGH